MMRTLRPRRGPGFLAATLGVFTAGAVLAPGAAPAGPSPPRSAPVAREAKTCPSRRPRPPITTSR